MRREWSFQFGRWKCDKEAALVTWYVDNSFHISIFSTRLLIINSLFIQHNFPTKSFSLRLFPITANTSNSSPFVFICGHPSCNFTLYASPLQTLVEPQRRTNPTPSRNSEKTWIIPSNFTCNRLKLAIVHRFMQFELRLRHQITLEIFQKFRQKRRNFL